MHTIWRRWRHRPGVLGGSGRWWAVISERSLIHSSRAFGVSVVLPPWPGTTRGEQARWGIEPQGFPLTGLELAYGMYQMLRVLRSWADGACNCNNVWAPMVQASTAFHEPH